MFLDLEGGAMPEVLTNGSNVKTEVSGLVFDIQGHSVHDGPGTRTTVFLNGCPLDCIWCCNPEGLFTHPVVMYKESRCKHCGSCIKACQQHAISVNEEKKLVFDRSKCDNCKTYECLEACYHEGLSLSGDFYTVERLINRLKRDQDYWGSRGGVTFSGGEPLRQKDFILEVLKECKKNFWNTCIETTSCIESKFFLEVINYVDWMFTDIKHMNSDKHKELTGVGNELILSNIKALAEKSDWGGFIVPRIPIVPGYNEDEENIRATARFIKEIDLELINILPFHRLGESKYRQLGQVYRFEDQTPPSDELMINLKRIIEEEGIICYIGYETPF